jgi:hypothetical protein
MKVTEHNITDWKLNQTEISALIQLAKKEMEHNQNHKATELFYGMIVGKLLIMRNDEG